MLISCAAKFRKNANALSQNSFQKCFLLKIIDLKGMDVLTMASDFVEASKKIAKQPVSET